MGTDWLEFSPHLAVLSRLLALGRAGSSVPTAELGLSSSLAPGLRPPTATHISRAGHCSSTSTGHEKAGRGLALHTPSSHIALDPVRPHQQQCDILSTLPGVT